MPGFFTSFLGGEAPDYANMAREAEQRRQDRINLGVSAVNRVYGRFNPQFYQQRTQDYVDYAMPQLSDQYRQTRSQIGFNLANRGLNKSGAADNQWSDLAISMAKAKQNVVDVGVGQAQDLRRQIENSRDQVLSQLYQSADPASAAGSAISTAAGFSMPSTFAPLANQFNNLIQQYYNSQLINSFRMSQPVIVGGISSPTAGAPTGPSEVSGKE